MKKTGDLLTALGTVGLIAIVLELVIGWRMIPQSIMSGWMLVSFIVFLIGLMMRNRASGGNFFDKNELRQISIAMLIFGGILLLLVFYGLFASGNSLLVQFVNQRFLFLVVFGLLFLLAGIITRSIGKSKENQSEGSHHE